MSTRPTRLAAVADLHDYPTARAQRTPQWCAGAACGIALAGLAGWVLDLRFLAGQWGTYIPMAPSTALAVLLLGGAIFAQARWPFSALSRRVGLTGAGVAGLLGLLVLVEFVTGFDSGQALALARSGDVAGLGHMSPMAAAALLLQSAALLLMLYVTRWRMTAALAFLLAGMATVINLVVLVGYLYGAPPLYGGPIVPVAFPTAVAFILLGAGQLHLLLPRVSALRAWQRGTMRGILVRAFLPAVLSYVILDGLADTWREKVFRSTSPALWHALVATAIGGLFVAIITWVARRTGDEIESAHTALRESENRFRTYVEHAPDGVFVMNAAGFYQDVNTAGCSLMGYSRDELLHMHASQIVPREALGELQTSLEALQHDGRYSGEFTFVRKDGSVFVGLLDATRLDDNQYLGFVKDITERKRAEEARIASEVRYRRLFESAKDGILILDADTGMIVDVNPFLVELLGFSRETFLGKTLWDLGFFKDIIANQASFAELQREQYVRYEDKPLETMDGRRIDVEFVSNVYLVNDHKVIQCNVRDITERKRGREKQAKLESQLQQAQKMESVGRLAGGVAHDFNNMLAVILGYATLAIKQVDPAQRLHADLLQIRDAANRSVDLTRQLLAFARKQTVAPKVLDLNDTVAGILTMLHRLIGENIDLKWRPGADLWRVKVDPSQIDQILANLCVNARDAILGVGKMTIETGNSTIDEDYGAAHAGCAPGRYVRIVVSDNGCGMDKETLSHLFEPFFTTKAVGEGTGLGLATVYGVVKQNGGFINVYSEPNHGTTFTIYLPRHHVGEAEQARAEGEARPAPRGHETILLVEDEPAILRLTKTMLEQLGYTVISAATPGEAISLATTHAGAIHLLMTDVVMPEMNGRILARNLLSLHPLVKRLFMSGYTADVIAHHGVLDEGLNFIQKPFSAEDLATKVRDALDAPD